VIYNNEITHGAFQTYTLLRTIGTTKLPDNVSFKEGSVFPMAFATAACALYIDLKIPHPSISPDIASDKKGLLVWGGAASVGTAVIQLAKNSGFKVFAAASQKHEKYLKSLGAYAVFDYNDHDVVKKISEAAKQAGIELRMGVDVIAEGDTAKLAADVLVSSGAGGKLDLTLPWPEKYEKPTGVEILQCAAYKLGTSEVDFGEWFFNEYLQGALENGSVVPAPIIQVVEGGIAATQKVWDMSKKGVSGKKLVVEV
jgi:NADPH:quinone reductase-like Zn-dependent oxidoreductase